jgi:hypothetical protein
MRHRRVHSGTGVVLRLTGHGHERHHEKHQADQNARARTASRWRSVKATARHRIVGDRDRRAMACAVSRLWADLIDRGLTTRAIGPWSEPRCDACGTSVGVWGQKCIPAGQGTDHGIETEQPVHVVRQPRDTGAASPHRPGEVICDRSGRLALRPSQGDQRRTVAAPANITIVGRHGVSR